MPPTPAIKIEEEDVVSMLTEMSQTREEIEERFTEILTKSLTKSVTDILETKKSSEEKLNEIDKADEAEKEESHNVSRQHENEKIADDEKRVDILLDGLNKFNQQTPTPSLEIAARALVASLLYRELKGQFDLSYLSGFDKESSRKNTIKKALTEYRKKIVDLSEKINQSPGNSSQGNSSQEDSSQVKQEFSAANQELIDQLKQLKGVIMQYKDKRNLPLRSRDDIGGGEASDAGSLTGSQMSEEDAAEAAADDEEVEVVGHLVGSFRKASSLPISRSRAGSSSPMPRATRLTVPNRFANTGIECPFGFSNSSAGPPARSTRSPISVISSFGSTSAPMRLSSPRASSWAMKSRRSAYRMRVIPLSVRRKTGICRQFPETDRASHPVRSAALRTSALGRTAC